MNSSRWIVIAVAAAAIGFGAAWWIFGQGPDSGGAGGEPASGTREILYWVAPMDPNYRRDQPGKSPMGMDLVPVYADGEGDASDTPSIRIDPAVINNIGVQIAEVQSGTLARLIDTVGFITPDADRIAHVHVRTEGWIERLEADNKGEAVARGEVLFEIYSPALVSAQDEYLQARRIGQSEMIKASSQRLFALGMSADQVDTLEQSEEVRQRFAVRSPQDGYVMELNVREGMFVQPGTTIMSLADLSEIWVDVDVFEQQIGWVEPGQHASMQLPFAPQRTWRGEVDYVYPTIRPESRTARVRLTFDNPDLQLKPNMYAKVVIEVAPREGAVHVPTQAVIRTGRQERVMLALGEGRFRPAEVRTGLESGGRTEIVEGLSTGERIVVSSQFLIDSEASMDASLLRMLGDGQMDHSGHDMEGMDQSGHEAGEMDHSSHDMEAMDDDGPETGDVDRSDDDMKGMDHSGHDRSREATQHDAPTSDQPSDRQQHDHGSDNDRSTAHAPPQARPRRRGPAEKTETALPPPTAPTSLPLKRGMAEAKEAPKSLIADLSLPRSREIAGVAAHSDGGSS